MTRRLWSVTTRRKGHWVVVDFDGSLRLMIKDAPDDALQIMHDQYSGAPKRDSIKVETRWVTEKAKGDPLSQYISTMPLLRDKLKAMESEESEKD